MGSQHLGDIGEVNKIKSLEDITKTAGNVGAMSVSDGSLQQIMGAVLTELKILNLHLMTMTDIKLTKSEVE